MTVRALVATLLAGDEIAVVTRIGLEHGFAGEIYRIGLVGGSTLVAKVAEPQEIEAEVLARRSFGRVLGRSIPMLIDADASAGVMLMEDVSPARQGDVLEGCSPAEAEAVYRVLGRLHGATTAAAGEWAPTMWEPERWASRVAVAGDRYPAVRASRRELLDAYPTLLTKALDRLGAGPLSVMHGDVHLDNALWRSDGEAVLVDWTRHRVGPPAWDLASLTMGLDMPDPGDAYRAAFSSGEMADDVLDLVEDARLLWARGVIGWAGLHEHPREGSRAGLVLAAGIDAAVSAILDRL